MNTDIRPADTSADSKYTVGSLSRDIISRLTPVFGVREATAMNRIIWEDLKGYSPTDLIIKSDLRVSEYMLAKIDDVMNRLEAGEPIQYILGKARFYGMDFAVSPAVLIPRPETAQLIDIIADDYGKRYDLRVLDIGTGSGCIAIALSRVLPFSIVEAFDISKDALEVAQSNAERLHARVRFINQDILTATPPHVPMLDIVVSNPPYIMESERESMESYVKDHEPAEALFVPDNNPLVFYNAACNYAREALIDDGSIYFELNPLTAERLATDMRNNGWKDVTLMRDDQGTVRFLKARVSK